MTDPNTPETTPPPASGAPQYASAPPPASGAPQYAPAPPPGAAPPAQPTIPGKTLGIVAFAVSFFVQIVGIILGIIALVQSKKAGYKNGWALAAIIVGAVLLVVSVIIIVALIMFSLDAVADLCDGMAPGVYELSTGGTITCE